MKTVKHSQEMGYLYAALTLLIWSGFLIVSRLGGKSPLNPFDITALRLAGAALALAPWWIPRVVQPRLRLLTPWKATVFALLAGILYPLIAYTGLRYAPASHGAVLIAGMLPFFTTVLTVFLLKEFPNKTRIAGLILILTGVLTLLLSGKGQTNAMMLQGDALLLTGSLVWSLFTVLLKRWQASAFEVTLAVTAVAALSYLPIYLLFLPKQIMLASWSQIGLQFFFQGILVVCVAMWTYAKAAEILGTVRVVIMMSGVPVVGALLGIVFLNESLSEGVALGVSVTFIGALIGAMAKPEKA